MKLKILDINKEIKTNKLLEVKNANPPVGIKYDPEGIWSEEVFGKVGSRERKNRFGYIDIKSKIFHPQAYDIIKTISEPITKIITRKARFKLVNGKFIPSSEGETGLSFLIRNLDNFKFADVAKKEKPKEAAYLDKNKKLILIDKWLVVPPGGIRDIDMTRKDAARTQSEINNYYKGLLFTVQQIEIAQGDDELSDQFIDRAQKVLVQISSWIKQNLMKGKGGLFRGSMLKKSMDQTTRIILASSPRVNLGEIGLPWHTLLSIYEPLITNYVYQKDTDHKLLKMVNTLNNEPEEKYIDYFKFTDLIKNYGKHPDLVPIELKELFLEALNYILKDGVVLAKRDPSLGRNSWFSAKPVITEGRVATLNSLDLLPLGGDCDGDTVSIAPLFTKQAKAHATANMNPAHAKSKWFDSRKYNKTIYNIELDSVAAVYAATKD